jgi:leucyl aminopeptidase (aminopeptidase T)
MAEEWRQGFLALGINCPPLLHYAATGANNGELPESALQEGIPRNLVEELTRADIVLALTRYSATAPLSSLARHLGTLRVASMPGVLRRMEQTALAADYAQVALRADLLAQRLTDAEAADVTFSTGHTMHFDLRYRTGEADNGRCHREQAPHLINLPSGEGFIVPYEGERPNDPSQTVGTIPVQRGDEIILLHVDENIIREIEGNGPEAETMRELFAVDPARRNIAELGLGCNERAIVSGCVLEDEKAGMHWAYGRSEHIGGTVGPGAFTNPAHVIHNDIVYAPESPIGIQELTLTTPGQPAQNIMKNSRYTLFD